MIRLIQRRLIVPRGDTGTFSIPMLANKDGGDVSVFTIFNPLKHEKIFEKVMQLSEGTLSLAFSHGDTVNLPVGQYVWDIKFYSDPVFVDEQLVGGTEVDSYYAAFSLPVCEIRETGDSLLMSDDAPQATLAPEQIDLITGAINEANFAKDAAATSEANAATSAETASTAAESANSAAELAQQYSEDAIAAKNRAVEAETNASVSATEAAASAAEVLAEMPTKVSDLENDLGFLTEHQDISGKADIADLAIVATSGSYEDLENKPFIPANTSDLVNDSNFAVDANYIHTDNNYTTAEKDKLSSIAAGAEVNVNADWNAVSGDAQILNKPTNVSAFTNDVGYLTEHQDISGKANSADLATVATSGSYNDLSNKPFIPSAISDLTDDSGHYTKPVGGIPASDLANGVLDVWSGLTYHTSTMSTDSDSFVLGGATDAPTEINKCLVTSTPDANVIPKFDYQGRLHSVTPEDEWDGSNAVATTEYVDNMISDNMPEIPTNVSELNNDAGYLTSFTETDPTVPSWAKASQKPTYTAAEVGAPTVQEMNTAIGNAIGNINSFDMAVVQALPTQDISTHTIYLVPKTGETNDVYDEYVYINNAWEMVGNTQVDLSNYVQKTDYATADSAGIVKIISSSGLTTAADGTIAVAGADSSTIKTGTNARAPIVSKRQHESTFYGLAKAAGDTTQSQSDNAVGTYTAEAKVAIQNMLDVPSTSDIPDVPVQDVQIDGTSILQNGIAVIPVRGNVAGTNELVTSAGISNAFAAIFSTTLTQIKAGTQGSRAISPANQDAASFYGLAKAAGDTTQSQSANTVGTYTDEAKAAIQTMLDVPSTSDIPDVQINSNSIVSNGIANITVDNKFGVNFNSSKKLTIYPAEVSDIDGSSTGAGSLYRPIVPAYQHASVFYGLAKLAGDNSPAKSNIGLEYTDAAKTAIQNMLDVPSKQDVADIIAISTTQPTDPDTKIWIDNDSSGTVQVPTVAEMNAALGGKVSDVQIDGNSIISNNIANIPVMSDSDMGVAKRGNGLYLTNGVLNVNFGNAANIKTGTATTAIASIAHGGEVVFYGLSKAAGVDLANETVTLGTYPETSKTAIRSMIGAAAASDIPSVPVQDVQIGTTSILNDRIAKIPIATYNVAGVSQNTSSYGVQMGGSNARYLQIYTADTSDIKAGTHTYRPITPSNQHQAVFYGLSQAAGVDLANETVTVGTYPETSKTAIRSMLGATSSNVIAVQDTQPTDTDTKIWLPETAETPVQIPTMEDLGDYVQKTDYATSSTGGVIKIGTEAYGLSIDSNGQLMVAEASTTNIKEATGAYRPLTAPKVGTIAFYGLAKASGDTTQAASSNAVGTYTDAAKTAIRNMIGAGTSNITDAIIGLGSASEKSIVNNNIIRISTAFKVNSSNELSFNDPPLVAIKSALSNWAITPMRQSASVFYGLAQAAGDTTQAASDNAIGTYTADASAAIRSMLGAVGTNDVATATTYGLVKVDRNSNAVEFNNGALNVVAAGVDNCKDGGTKIRVLVPYNQHFATFYGLAKAAGDTTQSASSNAVGTYTSEAKSAIQQMLGIDLASIASEVEIPLVETVSGASVTISGQPNTRYMCGEVTSISITPPASGTIDVVFTSGSTVAILTLPSTVKMPEWFDVTTLDTNTIYEILITDGIYGSVMTWAA